VTGGPTREPGARRHAAGWGFVALGLVAVVAMEANGAAWSTRRGASVHAVPHSVVVAGVASATVVALAAFCFAIATSRGSETPEQRRRRWAGAVAFFLVLALLAIGRIVFHPAHPAAQHVPLQKGPTLPRAAVSGTGSRAAGHGETWWPLVVVGVGTSAALLTAMVRRPVGRHGVSEGSGIDPATLAMLDASLDDLRREADPRRAVTAAYARTERGLAARGFARRPSETPTEYLQRALAGDGTESLARHDVAAGPLGELTALAERARFSAQPVDEAMRARAIDALETLRRELGRAVESNRDRVH
jgi:hypothetical protein